MKPTITPDEKLQAFALYVLAVQRYAEVRKYEKAIAQIFGDKQEFNDHVQDAIYGDKLDASMSAFNEILEGNKITVRKK